MSIGDSVESYLKLDQEIRQNRKQISVLTQRIEMDLKTRDLNHKDIDDYLKRQGRPAVHAFQVEGVQLICVLNPADDEYDFHIVQEVHKI